MPDTNGDRLIRDLYENGLDLQYTAPRPARPTNAIERIESHPVVKTASKARSVGHSIVDVDARIHYLVGSVVVFTRAISGEFEVMDLAITGVVILLLVAHYVVVVRIQRH